MSKTCIKACVSGRVQGVWYRKATQEQAVQRGLTGWAKNLPDGTVEVMLCGDAAEVEAVREWLWKGPPLAKVTAVDSEDQPYQALETFVTS